MCKFLVALVLALAAVLTVDRLLFHPYRVLREAEAKWSGPHESDRREAIDATLILAEGQAEWPI